MIRPSHIGGIGYKIQKAMMVEDTNRHDGGLAAIIYLCYNARENMTLVQLLHNFKNTVNGN